jgi:hypothetical protein
MIHARAATAGVIVAMVSASAGTLLLASPARAQVAKKDAPKPRSLSQSLTGTAKADFEAAKLLANDGDFVGALIKFQSAYEASKDARVLWNIAFCQKNLRRYSKVVTTLKRYLDEGGALLSASDRKDAQDLIAMIEPFTTRATFRVNQEGAQVYVDDELVGSSPLGSAQILDIGERKIRVTKEGFRTYERALLVGGGAELTVDVPLEKEVHEGKLVVEAPAGATIFLDGRQVGVGKTEQSVASGGHQLRVVENGMRPYQTEIVVQDRETRSLNVALEAQAAAEKPVLRVAVGCTDAEPKGPEDGLVVNIDGPEVLPPGPVKKRTDDSGRNVVERVEYPIAPGPHTIRVGVTECRSVEATVVVDPIKGADITGALESSRFVLFRGPQGSPGALRLSGGVWLGGGEAQDSMPEHYSSHNLSVTGLALEVGIVGRWFGLYLQGGLGGGSFSRETFNTNYALPDPAHVSWERLFMRLGPRIPLNRVAVSFGPLAGIEEIDLENVRVGHPAGIAGAFGEIDVQPICDWGIFAMGTGEKSSNGDQGSGTFALGVFWEPNGRCREEQATKHGLRTGGP